MNKDGTLAQSDEQEALVFDYCFSIVFTEDNSVLEEKLKAII